MLVTISFDYSGDLSHLTPKAIKALTAKLDKYGYGDFWEIDGDTLTIVGSADFDDYDYNEDDVAEEIRYVDLDGHAEETMTTTTPNLTFKSKCVTSTLDYKNYAPTLAAARVIKEHSRE